MSIESRVDALAVAIGVDYGALMTAIGAMPSLDTTASDLVGAINEINSAAAAATGIDDLSVATTSTWSSNKIGSELSSAVTSLVDSSPALLDTLNELAAALENNPDVIASLRALITDNASAITTLSANVGDTNADFVATYTAAKTA